MFAGFAKLRAELTIAAMLRRISRELHRMNELTELKLKFQNPGLYKAYKSGRTATRLTEISVAKVQDWNDEWNKNHPLQDEDDLA